MTRVLGYEVHHIVDVGRRHGVGGAVDAPKRGVGRAFGDLMGQGR